MSDKPTSAAESIFMAALEIETAEERSAYVNESCGADARLLARVQALLEAHELSDSFLEKPPAALEATILSDASGNELAASLDAGLAPAFGRDKAVVMGSAGHSVLQTLGNTIDVPRVSLRESEAGDVGPVQRPSSSEIPSQQADSRYQLQGEIARGGMGAVIKGRDTDLGRDLAIKVLLDSHKDKPEVIQRFVEEAQIGGQLQHPGIAPVYELGQFADQRPFFSMKLVKGQTLSKLLADREDAAEDRGKYLGVFEQVCQTMAYAHSRGVIHRDLKPANIMVGAFGEVQVMDWGLAKVLAAGGVADEKKSFDNHQGKSFIRTLRSVGSDTPGTFNNIGSQTQMGSVMGTPAYMPPEQALGEIDNMDERADVFGLGAILCEILTGKPPYVADDGTLLYRMASRGKLDDCFERLDACGADSELIVIAKKCLELEPADRPRDAGALSQRITEYLESVESRLRDAEKQRAAEAARLIEERKRRRIILASSCAVATLLLVIAVGSMFAAGHFREMERVATLTAEEKASLAEEMTLLAEKNQELADAKDHEAENARAKEQAAITAKELAIQAQKELRKELYLSDMQEVRQAYHEGALNRIEELLTKYLPSHGEPDQRGWEWHYWWRANHRHTQLLQRDEREEPFSDLVISPDESWFAIREWRDLVRIYDGRARQTKLRSLPVGVMDPRYNQGRIAVSPDGRLFAAISDRAHVKLWSTEDWSELSVLRHQRDVSTIGLSSNGLLAAGDDLGNVTVWDIAQQTQVGEPLETGGMSTCLAFSPDGRRLATGHEGSAPNLLVWDVSTQTIDKKLIETHEPVKTLAWTRKSNRSVLAAGFVNGFVRLWDGETYDDRSWLAAGGPIESLSFSSGGDKLVAGTARNNEIHVWETDTRRLLTTAKGHSQPIRGVGFTDDGTTVLSSSADGTIKSWEVARSAPFDPLPMPTPNATGDKSLTFSADGNVLWRGGMGGPAHRWDLSDAEPLPIFDAHEPHKRAAYSANGRYTVEFMQESAVEYRAQVYKIDGAERVLQRDRVFPGVDGPPDHLAISDDGQVVAWSRQATLVWSHLGEDVQKTFAEDGPVTSLVLSPNGRTLACARTREHRPGRWGRHMAAQLWDVSGDEPELMSTSWPGDVNQAQFSPDGALLALATWGGLNVYATATGQLRGQFRGHAGSVTALDFSRDGRMLVSGGYDGTVRLWNVHDQTLLLTLNTSEQNIVSVAFSPDGGTIASISESGDARLWRGGTEEMQGDRYWKWLADAYSRRAHKQVWPGKFAEALSDYRKLMEIDKQDSVERANKQLTNSASKLVSWKPVQNASPDGGTCRFTLEQPPSVWLDPDFDDSAWQSGGPALARDSMRGGWPNDQIWVRYEIELSAPLSSPLVFLAKVDGKATVFVNGQEAAKAGSKGAHFQIVRSQVPLQQGRNVIAVHCDRNGMYGAIHLAPGTLRSTYEVLSLFAKPEAPLLQHATILQTVGNWDEAAACYATVLQTRSQKPNWTDGSGWKTDRSKMLKDLVGQDSLFDALRQRLPDAHDLWLARGRSLALRNQWQAAGEAFSRYLALASPSEIDAEVGFEIACCHLILDDLDEYHHVVSRFRESADEKELRPFTAFVLARTAGLAPQTPELAKRAVRWGEQGLSDDARPWELHALGLALYRAGDHEAAIARLSESLEGAWYDVANQLALALVYHDSEQHQQARQLLREAQQWRDEQLQRASDGVAQEQVIDWLAVHALLREAEGKIGTQ